MYPRFNVLPFINALAFIAASRTTIPQPLLTISPPAPQFSQRPISQLSIIVKTGLHPQSRGYIYPRRDSTTIGAKLEQSTPSARLDSRAAETGRRCFQSHALPSTPLLSYQHPHEALALTVLPLVLRYYIRCYCSFGPGKGYPDYRNYCRWSLYLHAGVMRDASSMIIKGLQHEDYGSIHSTTRQQMTTLHFPSKHVIVLCGGRKLPLIRIRICYPKATPHQWAAWWVVRFRGGGGGAPSERVRRM